MNIRRKLIHECKGHSRLQKALALAILMKAKLGRSSMMRDFTVNKIHVLTHLSPTTIRKYLPIMREQGWLHFSGRNNQHLVISALSAKTSGRNVCIDKFCFDSFKDVYRSLRAYIALLIQSRKDFIKRTLQIVANPQKGQDFMAARKYVKRLVAKGLLSTVYESYKEFGLSFRRIASETGVCVRTAQRIMRYAEARGWVARHHHQKQFFSRNVNFRAVDGYTFTTRHNLYLILANTYELERGIASDLCNGTISW